MSPSVTSIDSAWWRPSGIEVKRGLNKIRESLRFNFKQSMLNQDLMWKRRLLL